MEKKINTRTLDDIGLENMHIEHLFEIADYFAAKLYVYNEQSSLKTISYLRTLLYCGKLLTSNQEENILDSQFNLT
ncbi:MAG: hypothetical protein FWD82_09325 [Defluviitaleaceae bacterium]|nr:hypothetical protein [Defluviitaleaceae bacterium]